MGKRANGEGTIKRLPSGSWHGQIMDGYTAEGKRNTISFTAPTKTEVQQRIREYYIAKENGEIVKTIKSRSFSYWADLWYSSYRGQVQASTYSGYKYTLKLLKDHYNEIGITEIKPLDISKMLNGMVEAGCSSSKVSKCRAMLIQIFDFAESNDAVKRNPARLAKVVRDLEYRGDMKDAFTEEEVEMLLENLPENKIGHSIRLLLGSGMRVQELLALTQENIAEDGSEIEIKRAVKMVDGKPVLGSTKSRAGVRVIPIPEDYRESAMYLKQRSGKAFVWCSGRGNLLYGVDYFRKIYYREIRKIPGARDLPPHCCRHTYVSRLEARGVPMEQIARLVGHTKIATTDIYLHLHTNVLQAAVDVLNKKGGAA